MKEKIKGKPAATVALMMGATLLSKVLGMLRSVLMADHYGTGVEAAAFSEASHIPLTFFDLLFGAAILGCFIPVYNSFGEGKQKEADRFGCNFLHVMMLAAGLLALVGMIFAEGIMELMAPDLDGEIKALAAKLLRIMFPMIIFTAATFTLVGLMQSRGRYLLPAAVSAISNGAIIVYFLFFDHLLGDYAIYGLAAAYLGAWLLQFLTLAVPLLRGGFVWQPVLDFRDGALIRSIRAALPIMVGSWLTPVSILAGLYFASFVAIDGAVTMFDYGYAIFAIIAGTLTYSICNYAFPLLSRLSGRENEAEWGNIVSAGLGSVLSLVLPFAAAVLILAGEGVAVLYLRGEFTAEAARQTAWVLRCMAVGMPAFAVIEVCSRVFYSRRMLRPPVLAALVGIGANVLVSRILVGFPALRVGAVGLGFAAGQIAAALTLVLFLAVRTRGVVTAAFGRGLLAALARTLVSAAVMLVVYRLSAADPYTCGMLRCIFTALITFVPGAVCYLLLLFLPGRLKRKFCRKEGS